ncbi:hypothetical protein [Cellulophaga lytica]|uniref:hypothetical protein n=1 Tax=Cellulophaga lytica TaxID=979 RepID=UPI003CE53863
MKNLNIAIYEKALILFGLFAICMLVQECKTLAPATADNHNSNRQHSNTHRSARQFAGITPSRDSNTNNIVRQVNSNANNQDKRSCNGNTKQAGQPNTSGSQLCAARVYSAAAKRNHRTLPPNRDGNNNRSACKNQNALVQKRVALVRIRVLNGFTRSKHLKNRFTNKTIIKEELIQIV